MADLLDVLKRKNENENQETDDGEKKEYYLISATWVQLALPFIEEFVNENTQIKEEEFFQVSKIFNKCLAIYDTSNTKIKNSNFVYPYKINNHDILEHKDIWYDYDEEYKPSNVLLARGAKENQNFFYLSKKHWTNLSSIFGCVNQIPRFSMADNSNQIDTNLIKVIYFFFWIIFF